MSAATASMKRRAFCAAVALPLAVSSRSLGGQTPDETRRVGYLSDEDEESSSVVRDLGFRLRELGYVQGSNLVIAERYAEGRIERLPGMAVELVDASVEALVVAGPRALQAARAASKAIPIVMVSGSTDPVADDLALSWTRPRRNVTGLASALSLERSGRQLQLLKEAAPDRARVAVCWDPDLDLYRAQVAASLETSARKLGVVLQPAIQLHEKNLGSAFATMLQRRADAMIVFLGGASLNYRHRIAELALANRLPAIATFRSFAEAGGLMSYGTDLAAVARRAADYVDRILKGARAGDLPIERPTKYELVVNLDTARKLGLAVPQSLVVRADRVIV